MRKVSAGTYALLKIKLDGTVAPAVTDDSGDGYGIGSTWVDTVAGKVYQATDVTVGAAVWKELTGGGITSLNGETGSSQTFAYVNSGAGPTWTSAGGVHTLGIPDAGTGVARGLITNGAQGIVGDKVLTGSFNITNAATFTPLTIGRTAASATLPMLYIENHPSDSSANGMVRLVNTNAVSQPEVAAYNSSALSTKYFSIQAGRYQAPAGTNLLPAYTFHTDIDTGAYLNTPGVYSIAADGDTKFTVNGVTDTVSIFALNIDAGLSTMDLNQLAVTNSGTDRLVWDDGNSRWNTDVDWLFGGSSVTITTLDAGSTTVTSLLSSGNVNATTFFRGGDESSAAPTFSFLNDTNTGVYSGGADHFTVSSGGTDVLQYDANDGAGSRWEVLDEATFSGISGDGSGKAVCIKADGNLGTCTDAVGGGGTCTCS
jgi:hypothetical protein